MGKVLIDDRFGGVSILNGGEQFIVKSRQQAKIGGPSPKFKIKKDLINFRSIEY